jgi:hypothetical protein
VGCKGMNKSFRSCKRCGKRLIVRMPNGIWCFQFGRKNNKDGTPDEYVPVEIFIHGSLKIKCLKRSCNHWNIFHYFPKFGHSPQSPRSDEGTHNQPQAEKLNHASEKEDHSN